MFGWLLKFFGIRREPPMLPIFDARSETYIATLLPPAQEAARRWLAACHAAGLRVKIIGGTRTYAEQNALYAKGRSLPGKVVTNARGGYSKHNFGIAWDFGVFSQSGDYLPDSPHYDTAGGLAEAHGLEWGGHWQSFVDRSHIQLRTGLTLAEMRARVAAGRAVV